MKGVKKNAKVYIEIDYKKDTFAFGVYTLYDISCVSVIFTEALPLHTVQSLS